MQTVMSSLRYNGDELSLTILWTRTAILEIQCTSNAVFNWQHCIVLMLFKIIIELHDFESFEVSECFEHSYCKIKSCSNLV